MTLMTVENTLVCSLSSAASSAIAVTANFPAWRDPLSLDRELNPC